MKATTEMYRAAARAADPANWDASGRAEQDWTDDELRAWGRHG